MRVNKIYRIPIEHTAFIKSCWTTSGDFHVAPVKSVLFAALGRKVNSNGALVAMPTGDVCMIADPERCWAEEKRRKYLANQVGK